MPERRLNKVSVLLEDLEFERFEAYCRERGHKKSTLIARLIREHLDAEAFYSPKQLRLKLPIQASSVGTRSGG